MIWSRDLRPRSFWLAAVIIGLVYAVVTPAFTVPDEREHFWRALAIGRGHVAPADRNGPVPVAVDHGFVTFSWFVTQVRFASIVDPAFRDVARHIAFARKDGSVSVIPLYTAVPYAPSAALTAGARMLRARPVVVFYAGRVANLMFWMGIVALAMRVAPQCAMVFGTVALLPMSLFLFGSWSGDAAAIALAFLVVALIVRAASSEASIDRGVFALAACALLLALTKPGYSLLPAMVLAIPRHRFASTIARVRFVAIVGVAAVAGTLISMHYFNRAYFNFRPTIPVDPAAQIECIRHDPARFAAVVVNDLRANGRFYVDQVAGRFAHNEIKLRDWVWRAAWITLAIVAFTTATTLPLPMRLLMIGIAVATVAGILTSQYLIWSVACGDVIEGVQGRYFLPVLPLIAVAIGGWWKWRPPTVAVLLAAVVCNGAALWTIVTWYA